MGEKNLSVEQQIIRISDIFTALLEDRYYRKAMKLDEAMQIIKEDYQLGNVEEVIYETILSNADYLYNVVQKEEANIIKEYNEFVSIYNQAVKNLAKIHNIKSYKLHM